MAKKQDETSETKTGEVTLMANIQFTDTKANVIRKAREKFTVSAKRAAVILAAKHKNKPLAVVVEIPKK